MVANRILDQFRELFNPSRVKTKFVLNPKNENYGYIDIDFNIPRKSDSLKFWLFFHEYNYETHVMYQKKTALDGL